MKGNSSPNTKYHLEIRVSPEKIETTTDISAIIQIFQKIKDHLKCDICKNPYDSNLHIPLMAKCGHTFCKLCIQKNKNITDQNKTKCPKDKKKIC